jgi:hypothetical protein
MLCATRIVAISLRLGMLRLAMVGAGAGATGLVADV